MINAVIQSNNFMHNNYHFYNYNIYIIFNYYYMYLCIYLYIYIYIYIYVRILWNKKELTWAGKNQKNILLL